MKFFVRVIQDNIGGFTQPVFNS